MCLARQYPRKNLPNFRRHSLRGQNVSVDVSVVMTLMVSSLPQIHELRYLNRDVVRHTGRDTGCNDFLRPPLVTL